MLRRRSRPNPIWQRITKPRGDALGIGDRHEEAFIRSAFPQADDDDWTLAVDGRDIVSPGPDHRAEKHRAREACAHAEPFRLSPGRGRYLDRRDVFERDLRAAP